MCYMNLKLKVAMKKFFVIFAALCVVATASAQEPEKTLAEAQIEYDRAVAEQKSAMEAARSEENHITSAANDRLVEVKREFETVKEKYKMIVAEQKRRLKEAKEEYDSGNAIYKQELTRAKQEIAAAKAKTKSISAEHKSKVAAAKAEISRIMATEQSKKNNK